MTGPAQRRWFNDYSEIIEFGRILADADYFDKITEVFDYLEKPWKWDPERDVWIRHCRPRPGDRDDGDDAAGARWDLFVEAVTTGIERPAHIAETVAPRADD